MLARSTSIIELCGSKIDGSGDWKDTSGANLFQWSEALDNAAWTKATVTVTADQVRLRDGTLGAEKLEPTAADSYLYQDVAGTVGQKYFCLFDIRSETGNVSLSIHAYDQAHGTILGTQAVTVTPHWQLFRVEGTLVAGDTHVGCTIGGNSTWSTGENIYAGRAWLVDEDVDSSFGVYHPTNATTKPRLDLAQSGSPTNAKAHVQSVDGNRIEAREGDGVNQYYSKAHHASMNIFDTDHTITILQLAGSDSDDVLFCHGSHLVDGLFFQRDVATDSMVAAYSSGGSFVSVASVIGSSTVGYYHVLQVVRSGNLVKVCMDGVCSIDTDVTGEGIDGIRVFYLGVYDGGGSNWWDGQISYTRIDAEALSAEELAYDREVLLGTVSNQPTNALSVTRATTAYVTFEDGTMAEIAPNQPRIGGPGHGLEVEGPVTNQILQSQDLSTTWSTIAATISTDVAVAPDGKTTVDGMVGTAITNNHGVCQNQLDLTADSYVFHIWARPGDQDWIYLYLTTIANTTAYFNVATGFVGTTGAGIDDAGIESAWGGFYHAWIVITGTVAQHTVCAYSAEADGDNQFLGDASTINTYVWQAQVEKGTFPSSIIPTLAVPVTRNADSATLDPHPVGKPEARALPEVFAPNTNADKITIYGEWKGMWSSSVDIDTHRRLVNLGHTVSTNNNLEIYVSSGGMVSLILLDNGGTTRYIIGNVDPVNFSEWFSVRGVIDFTDLSRSELYINGVVDHAGDLNMTGGATFNTNGNNIRFGANRTGVVGGFHWTRELRINNQEIRP